MNEIGDKMEGGGILLFLFGLWRSDRILLKRSAYLLVQKENYLVSSVLFRDKWWLVSFVLGVWGNMVSCFMSFKI